MPYGMPTQMPHGMPMQMPYGMPMQYPAPIPYGMPVQPIPQQYAYPQQQQPAAGPQAAAYAAA